ncbi:protein TolR [Psychrobium sp. 1_MG-2023]|uniref:protein TolR n=1 Tax=Psychrobium sp. 1_MG-2023 TaxID=3062624 RepID=UPI000C32A6BF|nr:protein TolR [Psychrobium sp. 1_MG-2023]MDP2560252.1 protein TolR [Psychrobium sp. 1_MG-2023]PKF57131.1 protein TolR [Alteromonadales bacterium alter-6D02]
MMQYQRKRRRLNSDINVVPYIDVMLVLLIIFMATAPLIVQGVKVDLPQAQAKTLTEDSKPPLIASVKSDGSYYLTVGDSPEQSLTQQELASLVAAHLQLEPDSPVMVKGDRAVSYDHILQLMVTLQAAGAPSVGLMTDPVEGQ